jgi:hypothetical protein
MELRRAGGERLFRINGAWQIFVLHLYQCTRILGTVHGLGNDQCHGFADKSNSPVCKHGPLRHTRAHPILSSQVEEADGLHVTRTHRVFTSNYPMHAWVFSRCFHVKRDDTCMRTIGS